VKSIVHKSIYRIYIVVPTSMMFFFVVVGQSKYRESESYSEEESQVQKLIGSIMMWRTILENLFPIILVCLIGAWSDKYGRKLSMMFVLSSFVIQHLGLMLCAQMKQGVGAWSVGVVSALIVSLAGNNACFGMSVFSYVADTTPKDKLTTRTAITGSCFFLGITLGLALGGVLASSTLSFATIFLIAALLESMGLLYLIIFIPNVRDEKAIKGISTVNMIKDVFNLQHISDAVSSVFKKRPGNDRKKLLLLLVCHSLVLAPLFGNCISQFDLQIKCLCTYAYRK
jgi:MFS family permease